MITTSPVMTSPNTSLKVKGAINLQSSPKDVKDDPFPLSEAALDAAHMAGFESQYDLLSHLSFVYCCDSTIDSMNFALH